VTGPRLAAFLAGQLTGDPAVDAVLRESPAAVLVKGSCATGLAGPASDLDLWVVTDPDPGSCPVELTCLVSAYLMARLPSALSLDPPVEVDVVSRVALAAQWASVERLLRDPVAPSWNDIEMVHELATGQWVLSSPRALGHAALPDGPDLAAVMTRWCRSAAGRSFEAGRRLLGTSPPCPDLAAAVLAGAVAELSSAVLAAHGFENPKAKWGRRQAERLGGRVGAEVSRALVCVDEGAAPPALEAQYHSLTGLLPAS
jgi:Nucleotidyltransferase domain